MSLDRESIERLRNDAAQSMRFKMEQALLGHDWVVDNHTISSAKLAELAFYAEMGRLLIDAWFQSGHGPKTPPLTVKFTIQFERPPSDAEASHER